MRNRGSLADYLAFLSLKYDVDPDSFFHALISAEKNHESSCGKLSIERRGGQKDRTILLITAGVRAVAQFPITKEFLLQQNNPIKAATKSISFRRRLVNKDSRPRSLQIKDLRIGMKGVSLKAEVVEVAKPTLVFTRFGGYASVANALLSDGTGKIKLCLWNEQIKTLSMGDTLQVENANISTFRGERLLRIGKKGNLSILEDAACTQEEAPNS